MKHPEIPTALLHRLNRLHSIPLSEIVGGLDPPPPLVELHTPLKEILRLLQTADHLWIKGPGKVHIPAGLVTHRDILASLMSPRTGYTGLRSSRQASIARGTADCAACYIAHKPLPLCRPDETVADLVRTAVRSGENVTAIVENNRFLGEVGVPDLIRLLTVHAEDS